MRRMLCGLVILGLSAAIGFAGPVMKSAPTELQGGGDKALLIPKVGSPQAVESAQRVLAGEWYSSAEFGSTPKHVPAVIRSPFAEFNGSAEPRDRSTVPENDECVNAYAFDLLPGVPVTISGDNTGATQDCGSFGTSFGEVWFEFTTYEPLTELVIRYCGTTPAFEDAYAVLDTSCPCSGDFISAYMHEFETCGDGNVSLTWRSELAPGTYYWPLLSDSVNSYAEGAYTVTFQAIGAMPVVECSPEAVYGQTLARGAHASTNHPSAQYLVCDNFTDLQKIGEIEWLGIHLASGSTSFLSCSSETPAEFEIKLYEDNNGQVGAEVASYVVTPTATVVAPYSYIADVVYYRSGPLTSCHILDGGWISIRGLANSDGCLFFWSGSADGDGRAIQYSGGSPSEISTDLAFCLLPGDCPDVYGACCDAYTGVCVQAEVADCRSPLVFTQGAQCGELDPPCGITGACCSSELACVSTCFEAECDQVGGTFFVGERCEDPEFVCRAICDHRIDLYSCLSGWGQNSLDVLVGGEVVLRGLTMESGQGPVSYVFRAASGETIQTVYHAVDSLSRAPYYELYDGLGYLLGRDGVNEPLGCISEPVGISVVSNCDEHLTGACCHIDGTCEVVEEAECFAGEFLGVGTPCSQCPQCVLLCPADGIHEAEACGEDTNGGCDSGDEPVFEPISCGDTICGTLWANFPVGYDNDWYELAPADEDRLITWTFRSQKTVRLGVKRAGVDNDCEDAELIAQKTALACNEVTINFEAQSGETYWLYLGRIQGQFPCDVKYLSTLSCETLTLGACCLPTGECIEANEVSCEAESGLHQGGGTVCGEVVCTPFYCTAGSEGCSSERIARVQLGVIDNSSDCSDGGYADYTALSTDALIAAGCGLVVENGLEGLSNECRVWLDYNHDYNFDDADEMVRLAYDGNAYRGEITPPVTAILGATRMRIRVGSSDGGVVACGRSAQGETEDYTVNLIDAPGACCTPQGECMTLNSAVDCITIHEGVWRAGEVCVDDGGDYVCPIGACCTPSYECVTADRDMCEQLYVGTWHIGETCVEAGGDFECPVPDFGACCTPAGGCMMLSGAGGEAICVGARGGVWYVGQTCVESGGDFVCPAIPSACCDGEGICLMLIEDDCENLYGGDWYPGQTCLADGGDFDCPPPGSGACCTGGNTCITMANAVDCIMAVQDGTWYPGETCTSDGGDFECPFSGGACCLSGGLCMNRPTEAACTMLGGTWHGGERCASDGGTFVCPHDGGACCIQPDVCLSLRLEMQCNAMGGEWHAGEKCAEDGGSFVCPTNGPGWCDLDGNEAVDYDDYVIFLAAFGGPVDGDPVQDADCDYDGSGAVGLADYNAWLQCYRESIGDPFAGPPSAPSPTQPGFTRQGGVKKKQKLSTGASIEKLR